MGSRKALSCYVLTHNSERYLRAVLTPVLHLVDELVVVDSGSADGTEALARGLGAAFLVHPLQDFASQRMFAVGQCTHEWILNLDSDEIPDESFVRALAELKNNGFVINGRQPDDFRVKRRWIVLGREVHSFFPIQSPDYPSRLYRKSTVDIRGMIHESLRGKRHQEVMGGFLLHHACDSISELYRKLNQYTSIAAQYARLKGKRTSWPIIAFSPVFAFLKWYLLKGGWKDGAVGLVLARYAFDYTYQKHLKLRYDQPLPGPEAVPRAEESGAPTSSTTQVS